MKLSTENQELINEMYPDGYEFKEITLHNGKVVDEHDFFHILFVKIISQPGQRTNILSPKVQIISVRDWLHQNNKGVESGKGMKAQIEKYGIGGITQFDEYAVLHDPIQWKKDQAVVKKKAETAAKTKATKDAKKEVKSEPTAQNQS